MLKRFSIIICATLILVAVSGQLWAETTNYTALRKFLSARMYGEAYMEILRHEIAVDQDDPKLTKLRKDLLERTKQRLVKQAKVNPDDPALFTILADISFHEGKLDEATGFINKALNNKPGPLANYVFAKILFKKGNTGQAFDQIGLALEGLPDSPVVFADFQFLYSCKSYGISTAKKIVKNKNFLRRVQQLAGDSGEPSAPESPFENDPTNLPPVVRPPETQPDPDPMVSDVDEQNPTDLDNAEIASIDDNSPLPDETGVDEQDPDEIDLPDLDSPGVDSPVIPRPTPVRNVASPDDAIAQDPDEEVDPEQEKIKKAEYWFKQAEQQFKDKKFDDSLSTLNKAIGIYPEIQGKDELKAKLDEKFELFKKYKLAIGIYEKEDFDMALRGIEKGWNEEPERFVEAPFYLGKIYLFKKNPDKAKALYYFNIVLQQDGVDPLLIREIKWQKILLLYELKKFEEAQELFDEFVLAEEKFAKNQSDYNSIKYGLFFTLHKIPMLIVTGFLLFLVLVVFVLRLLPAVAFTLFDPIKSAKTAFEKGNYPKAIGLIEKILTKEQPIQVERELIEMAVKAHYELKNFVKCQENARYLLEKFHDNYVAWGYLAKASLESRDSSDEAISMYETIYKENPENSEYLPLLADHYAKKKVFTIEAMNLMFTYFQSNPSSKETALALSEGYVRNKTMGEEVVYVLEEALKHKEDIEFRELLARNYSKLGRYSDAARECVKVLENSINNMGIHVVYSSSMKKLGMIEEAIAQYEKFLSQHPDNPQLHEIIAGLQKEVSMAAPLPGEYSEENNGNAVETEIPLPDLPIPDLPEPQFPMSDDEIESFIEPPPEGFTGANEEIPLPDFLKAAPIEEYTAGGIDGTEVPIANMGVTDMAVDLPEPDFEMPGSSDDLLDIPTLDPFGEDDLLGDLAGEFPEELGGPAQSEISIKEPTIDLPQTKPQETMIPEMQTSSEQKSENNLPSTLQVISMAREKAAAQNWEEVKNILSPIFASERSRDAGILLSDAHLHLGETEMSMEIIQTIDIDPELMGEDLKDVLYRIGLELEKEKKIDMALKMYDTICNVDINYRDAFDRSDKLYSQK